MRSRRLSLTEKLPGLFGGELSALLLRQWAGGAVWVFWHRVCASALLLPAVSDHAGAAAALSVL